MNQSILVNHHLPFTRFLTGPADYTYCWHSTNLKVTHAHQLALYMMWRRFIDQRAVFCVPRLGE